MNLTPQERNLTAHVLDKYVDLLIKETNGQLPSPKVMRHIEQLETIKSIFLKLQNEEPETVTGVLTIPTEPRDIDEIYSELCNHPDFVAGSYYDKESVIDIIFNQICADHDDDNANELFKDAEQIFENNERQIFRNIDNGYMYALEDLDILDDCDLTLEKQNK
jgi:hypothetical protein